MVLSAFAGRWREVREAREAGGGAFQYAPGEDAAELRGLIEAGTSDNAPREVIARLGAAIQGEILAARGLSEIVVAGGTSSVLIEGARGAFGFGINVTVGVDIREALMRADADPSVLACLPWPEISGMGQWWPMLNENRYRNLKVANGWPNLSGESEVPRVAIVAQARLSPSGNDHMIATAHDDRHFAEKALKDAGIVARVTARARSLALIRIQGFIADDDPRLDGPRHAGLDGLRIIGALPQP